MTFIVYLKESKPDLDLEDLKKARNSKHYLAKYFQEQRATISIFQGTVLLHLQTYTLERELYDCLNFKNSNRIFGLVTIVLSFNS